MSIIIINSRVFSAKNPTVNDASGVTMLFAEAGMIFGVPQNQGRSHGCARVCRCHPQWQLAHLKTDAE